jgi:hypothetical protein
MRDKSVALFFVVTEEAGDFFLDIFEDANSNKRRKLRRAQHAINAEVLWLARRIDQHVLRGRPSAFAC